VSLSAERSDGSHHVQIDHLILRVNDARATVDFFVAVLGFTDAGQDGPFSVVRVGESFTLQLAPWGTEGGEHLAFAMTRAEFDATFARIRNAGLGYGDSFHTVGSQAGPGRETGARGPGPTLYFFDPNKHLIEIRHYEAEPPR
jgi:catechol 2,3-dioxygenase-like lactoylglutathione lyase family enzyme